MSQLQDFEKYGVNHSDSKATVANYKPTNARERKIHANMKKNLKVILATPERDAPKRTTSNGYMPTRKLSVKSEEGSKFRKEKGTLHGEKFVKMKGSTVSKESTGMTPINKSIDRYNHKNKKIHEKITYRR